MHDRPALQITPCVWARPQHLARASSTLLFRPAPPSPPLRGARSRGNRKQSTRCAARGWSAPRPLTLTTTTPFWATSTRPHRTPRPLLPLRVLLNESHKDILIEVAINSSPETTELQEVESTLKKVERVLQKHLHHI